VPPEMNHRRRKIRVMIVEDSRVARELLKQVIDSDPRLEVVSTVESAEDAFDVLTRVSPDVISMDVQLPGMDGLEATRRIMEQKPTPIVVVTGNGRSKEPGISRGALSAGALAVVPKPIITDLARRDARALGLCTQLAIMSQVHVVRQRFNQRGRVRDAGRPLPGDGRPARPPSAFRLLGVTSSTGGPTALQQVLNALPGDFPLPIVVVQHMTHGFHHSFVSWLNDVCPFPVYSAVHGQVPLPGHVYVAPPDQHTEFDGRALAMAHSGMVSAQRPSGTVLFRSMARTLGKHALEVLLTGMGEDGAEGLREIRSRGGYTIAEDATTAVVYGMPAVAVELGAVCESLPLHTIGPRLAALAPPAPASQQILGAASESV
jgi:two-component system chemotaxis response regulator CheB